MSSLSHQALNNLVPIKNRRQKAIVFIDTSIAHWTSIIQKVVATARVIVIGSEDDGVREISKILAGTNCGEVHIVSSGIPGCIYLGNSEISLNTLNSYALEMSKWFIASKTLNYDKIPRIFIHGYNLAIGDGGQELIAKLNKITGAQICVINNLWGYNIFE